jgi:hypothetical protein
MQYFYLRYVVPAIREFNKQIVNTDLFVKAVEIQKREKEEITRIVREEVQALIQRKAKSDAAELLVCSH